MNEFAKGEYKVADGICIYVLNREGANRVWAGVSQGFDDEGLRTQYKEVRATAAMLAAAGNAATALAEAGYDAVEVFRALPDAMKALEMCECYPLGKANRDLLRRIKGE